MEFKIGKVQLGITSNGTPKALLWSEGSDYNALSQAIEVLGNEVLYVSTRKLGETIEIVQKGRWINVTVPKEFQDAVNSSGGERIRALYSRAVHGIDVSVNGVRPSIDFETAKVMITEDLEMFLKAQDFVLKTIKETDTEYTKEIVKNLKTPLNEQTLNPYEEVNKLTLQSLKNITKDYKITNENK